MSDHEETDLISLVWIWIHCNSWNSFRIEGNIFSLKSRYYFCEICVCVLALESQKLELQDEEFSQSLVEIKISVKFLYNYGETFQLPGCDHGEAAKLSRGDGKAAEFPGIDGKTEKFSWVYGETEEFPNSNGEAIKLWWKQ